MSYRLMAAVCQLLNILSFRLDDLIVRHSNVDPVMGCSALMLKTDQGRPFS